MTKANPYPTYEDAARDYLIKLHSLMQLSQETNPDTVLGAAEAPPGVLLREAGEFAEISASMIRLAQGYLSSAVSSVRDRIRGQFIDQATVELLLGLEFLKVAEEQQTGGASIAAAQATRNAALQEAISAATKSASASASASPAQGIPAKESYRTTTDSATTDEAAVALKLTVSGLASCISHRVQELGRDITFDIMAGAQKTEVCKGASLTGKEIVELLGSVHGDSGAPRIHPAVATILSNAHEKIMALLNRDVEAEACGKIRAWLDQIQQADKIEMLEALIENLFQVEALMNSAGIGIERPIHEPESLNKASDLVKALSDRFTVLIDRMRKLEDAIRMGKLIQIPQFLLTITAMQAALLAALVYSGHDSINRDLAGILRQNGLLAS